MLTQLYLWFYKKHDNGTTTLIQEISSYPSLEGQTYRQLISQSRKRVREITRDMTKYWEDCRRLHIRLVDRVINLFHWEKGQTAPAAEKPLKNRLRTV